MSKTTIAQIKKYIKEKGGTFKKCNFYLNSDDAYEVNSKTYTKLQLIEAYKMGDL